MKKIVLTGICLLMIGLVTNSVTAQTAVKGTNVTRVVYTGSSSGWFRQTSRGRWTEFKRSGSTSRAHATFTETGRDEWSVYLKKSDGARIQLDLYKKEVKFNGRKIYTIRGAYAGRINPVSRKPRRPTRSSRSLLSGYVECAREGQDCRFSGNGRVAYGANGRFRYKYVAKSIGCNNRVFGDPAPGVAKKCYVRTSGRVRKNTNTVRRNGTGKPRTTSNRSNPLKGYRFCAQEGKRCNTGTKQLTSVMFGANGKYKYRSVRGGVDCTTRRFGDPAPGVRKRCYVFKRKVSQSNSKVIRDRANNCRPNAYQIAVFYDSGYRGKCSIRGIGSYGSSRAIGLPNDSISSIIIGSKVFAVLCKDNNFRGTCQRFRTTDPNLGNNSVGNDSVSSIRVIAKKNIKNGASRSPLVTRNRGSKSRRVINGRNVGIVNYRGGTFTKSSTGKRWLEYKKGKRGIHATFTETGRDKWSVYLRKSDGARIQLDLYTKSIKVNGRKLFTIINYY